MGLNTNEAYKQGQNRAKVLRAVYTLNPLMTYRDARAEAELRAYEAGYGNNVEMWKNYVEGFTETIMLTEAELKQAFAAGNMSVEQLGQMIAQKLIEGPST